MLDKSFIPQKPFPDFKWQWATFAPTESINDPVVQLGVLFRMEKLETSKELRTIIIPLSGMP